MDIVLAEDEPLLAERVARSLALAGHAVRMASDGPSALREVTGGGRCDLLVLDVNLPGFDGFEVLRRIRGAGLPLRVLMLTARSAVGDRVAAALPEAGTRDRDWIEIALGDVTIRLDRATGAERIAEIVRALGSRA